ncbi:MAG: hypothetical protein U0Y96_16345 [Candidatus Kapaibacterium sp.]|nr:hypothetical protein [Bacteroidota bacterium]
MKLTLITLLSILLLSFSELNHKTDLLCQRWRQVGVKYFGKDYKAIDKSMSELIWFKQDGTFDKELYGSMKFKGKWLFSKDSTKLALAITEMNGMAMPGQDLFDNKYANDSLIKLTKDTLIDGQLKYFGKEKTYGHDDIYYVREN